MFDSYNTPPQIIRSGSLNKDQYCQNLFFMSINFYPNNFTAQRFMQHFMLQQTIN